MCFFVVFVAVDACNPNKTRSEMSHWCNFLRAKWMSIVCQILKLFIFVLYYHSSAVAGMLYFILWTTLIFTHRTTFSLTSNFDSKYY